MRNSRNFLSKDKHLVSQLPWCWLRVQSSFFRCLLATKRACVSLISELMFLHCSQGSCGMAVMFERDITTSIWLPCTLSNVPITTRSTYKYIHIQSIGARHYKGQILRSPDTGLKAAKLTYQDTQVPLRKLHHSEPSKPQVVLESSSFLHFLRSACIQ